MGIGLALVQQLVLLHGGSVQGQSAGPGLGSTFTFWLPAVAAPELAPPDIQRAPGSALKLVYVEDNPDAREMMARLLRMVGCEIAEVPDGAGTLAAVLATRPDAVVLDIGLPDMDGYAVARQLRAHPAAQDTVLIALTGYGQQRDSQQAAAAGFDAHLVKPVDVDELLKVIEAALAQKRALATPKQHIV